MLLQEELARNLVSMTSQTLYTTMTMAHSTFFWVTSRTPAVFEGLSKASSGVWGVPFLWGIDESPGKTGSTDEMGVAFYYYNAVHTIILLLTIWIYFKTISLVWRSVSAVLETTVGVWKILGLFASKLLGFLNRWVFHRWVRNTPPQRNEENIESVDGGSPLVSNPSVISSAVPHANADTTQRHSVNVTGQVFLPLQQRMPPFSPPIPLQRVLWYYHDPVTQKVMPWFPPPASIPPFVPVPIGAPQVGPPATQDPMFVPIAETRTEYGLGQNNSINILNGIVTDVANDNEMRMGNVSNELSPLFGCPRDAKTRDNGDETAIDKTAMGAPGEATVANQYDVEAGQSVVDLTTVTNDVIANDAAAATVTAVENRANPKKRKDAPRTVLSPFDGGTESIFNNAQQKKLSENGCHPTKKQKLQRARENAKAWAEETFGYSTD
mmetsp:Transcript_11753/g.29785  ORF Transcript_11753/g.29785 Transcript_11753/m.29785 type:complete len:438 (+) Transcript_11753:369-1682(+)